MFKNSKKLKLNKNSINLEIGENELMKVIKEIIVFFQHQRIKKVKSNY